MKKKYATGGFVLVFALLAWYVLQSRDKVAVSLLGGNTLVQAWMPYVSENPPFAPTPTPAALFHEEIRNLPAAQANLNALADYGDADLKYRFQFATCAEYAHPNSLTIHSGGAFMLDNRDTQAHIFRIGDTAYNIGALDFAIASAPQAGSYHITCDGDAQATLLVEP